MKTILQSLVLGWCMVAHAARQIRVPNNLANVQGNSSVSEPFLSPSFRSQQVFDASQFSFIGGATGLFSRVAFRVDGASPDTLMFSCDSQLPGAFLLPALNGQFAFGGGWCDEQAFLPGSLGGHRTAGDSISWVVANSNLTPSGSLDTFGLITRFDITIVPEPLTWRLPIAGVFVSAILFFGYALDSPNYHVLWFGTS